MNTSRHCFARRAFRPAVFVLFAAAAFLVPTLIEAQTYSSGQPVWPAFEGWEKNDDGSFSLLFGYMNDNWQEESVVPIGPDNNIQPGGPDQGQPTRFQPRRNRFMFKIRVPKDFGDKEMVWTLATQGKAQKAYGSLRPDLLIENVDIMSETGALGAGSSSPELRADKAPIVTIEGGKTRSAKVGQPLSLITIVTDDGVPRVRPPRPPGAGRGRESGDDSAVPARPSRRISVCISRGMCIEGAAIPSSSPIRSKPGKTRAPAPTRRGHRTGFRRRFLPTASKRYR